MTDPRSALTRVPPSPRSAPDPSDPLDDLLDQTVDLLLRRAAALRAYPAEDAGRAVADAARLTSAVAQVVRARHLHAGPGGTGADAASAAAVLAILTEADRELG